jgi:hypothetical protein
MVEKPKATPVGNEARDAASALGGFVYQIYQTALAWLDLPAGEFLFVEAGEDYVVAAQEALFGTQVKETSAAVTINSEGIVASIDSFVELRTKNLGLSVSLRHLTTSAITLEKAATDRLGSEPTLKLWKRLAKIGDAAPLRKILMASKVSADSKRFIESLNDVEFREEFLRRIHFDCGAPGATFIKRQVVARLQALIINRGGLGSQAESCFSQVFLLLLEKAASPGERHQRYLDRPGLENIIEQATHVSVRRTHPS